MKTIIHAVLFTSLMTLALSSHARDDYDYGVYNKPTEGDIAADLFFARPAGILGSAVGIVTHTVGLLFSVPGENFGETGEILVEKPLNYTFNRPLGHFEDQR